MLIINHELTSFANTIISSLNDSDDHTSILPVFVLPEAEAAAAAADIGSRGVHVANSHFSKINANNGNNGCLIKKWINNKLKVDFCSQFE